MKKAFLLFTVLPGLVLGVGCSDSETSGTGGVGGNGGMGGEPVIGPLTWTVSDYTVVADACDTATPNPPDFVLRSFEITIAGSTATLESLDVMVPATGLPLGGIADPYGPDDDPVVFMAEFTDGVPAVPDCIVDAVDTFTVELRDPTLSLDENTTVDVTWDHDESDGSDTPGECDPPVWFVDLPCNSQATFTLTQETE